MEEVGEGGHTTQQQQIGDCSFVPLALAADFCSVSRAHHEEVQVGLLSPFTFTVLRCILRLVRVAIYGFALLFFGPRSRNTKNLNAAIFKPSA